MQRIRVGPAASIRIHRRDLQEKVFSILGYSSEQISERFGHILEAFDYGAPPHGGIAPGIDRLVAILAGADSLREVIAFPKTQSGSDLLFGAPSEVDAGPVARPGNPPRGLVPRETDGAGWHSASNISTVRKGGQLMSEFSYEGLFAERAPITTRGAKPARQVRLRRSLPGPRHVAADGSCRRVEHGVGA